MSANPSRTGLKLFVVLLVLAGGAAAAFFASRPIARVETIRKGNVADVVGATVVVEPGVVSPIMSEVEGRLIESKLAVGTEFKAGDVIARIDPADVDLEIEHAQNEYDAADKSIKIAQEIAKLRVASAKEDLKEAERLFEKKDLAENDILRKRREEEVAEQSRLNDEAENVRRLAALKNTLKVAQRKKDKMTIKAPFDGVVTEVFVNPQDLVSGKQSLANLIALTRLVRAKIPEEHFAAVQVGQRVVVSLLGYREKTFEAKIRAKLPTSEPGTQRYSAFLDIEIEPAKLVPGLTGDAAIYVDEHRDVVLVPRRALSDDYVFVVEGSVVRQQRVELGFKDLNVAEVKTGLKPGDRVIVEELDLFRPGQRVRVAEVK